MKKPESESVSKSALEIASQVNSLLLPGQAFSTAEDGYLHVMRTMRRIAPRGYVDYIVLFHELYGWRLSYAMSFITACKPLGFKHTTFMYDWEEFGTAERDEMQMLFKSLHVRCHTKFNEYAFYSAFGKFKNLIWKK